MSFNIWENTKDRVYVFVGCLIVSIVFFFLKFGLNMGSIFFYLGIIFALGALWMLIGLFLPKRMRRKFDLFFDFM